MCVYAVLVNYSTSFAEFYIFFLLLVEEEYRVSEQYPSIYDEKWTYSQDLGIHIGLFKLSWH